MASFIYRRQLTIEWGQCDPAGIDTDMRGQRRCHRPVELARESEVRGSIGVRHRKCGHCLRQIHRVHSHGEIVCREVTVCVVRNGHGWTRCRERGVRL